MSGERRRSRSRGEQSSEQPSRAHACHSPGRRCFSPSPIANDGNSLVRDGLRLGSLLKLRGARAHASSVLCLRQFRHALFVFAFGAAPRGFWPKFRKCVRRPAGRTGAVGSRSPSSPVGMPSASRVRSSRWTECHSRMDSASTSIGKTNGAAATLRCIELASGTASREVNILESRCTLPLLWYRPRVARRISFQYSFELLSRTRFIFFFFSPSTFSSSFSSSSSFFLAHNKRVHG